MAGGTGGHIFPALAVAQQLKNENWDVSWIGTKQGLESKVVPAHHIEIDWLKVAGIRGKGMGAKLTNVLLLLQSVWQSFKIFRKRKPNVVLGMGGYVAGPGGLVSKMLNIPLVIHEQNRVPGTTNRLLVKKATKILQAFPDSFPANVQAEFTGNPLRSTFLNIPEKEIWTEALDRPFRILIVGGSQGAKILNDLLPAALSNEQNIEVMHQTGTAAYELVKKKYSETSLQVQVVEFINDISSAYQWSDLIICRSGAMTVSEVAASGTPAIFIPLPNAIDDHQTANARYLTDSGAGILLPQNELSADKLLQAIADIKTKAQEMSLASKNKARLDATKVVAQRCVEVAIS